VEVPVPPLATARIPETSLEPKAIAPITKLPFTERTLPVPRELIVLDPLTLKAVIVVVANVDVPVTLRVPEKEGLLATAIVEVPVIERLEPAVKRLEISEKTGAEDPAERRTWKFVPTPVFIKVEPS
jgi:hypothetical protein